MKECIHFSVSFLKSHCGGNTVTLLPFFCKTAIIPGQLILNKKQVTWQVKDVSIGW